MTLKAEDRETLVTLRLQRARETLPKYRNCTVIGFLKDKQAIMMFGLTLAKRCKLSQKKDEFQGGYTD